MPAYDDELFGPVAAIIGAKSEDDAVRIANDSVFGLGAAVFTGTLSAPRLSLVKSRQARSSSTRWSHPIRGCRLAASRNPAMDVNWAATGSGNSST